MTKRMPFILTFLVLLVALPALGQGLKFEADLSGDNEVPPVDTPTTGEAKFEVDASLTSIDFELQVDDGTGIFGVAGAHIHCAPEGVNGPVVVFLAGAVSGGGFNGDVENKATVVSSNIVNTACGSTIAELVQSFLAGQAYVNVHTPTNPGGVIRGQIVENQ